MTNRIEWEDINTKIKCLPAIASLHRILKKQDSIADRQLIASIVTDSITDNYKLEFNTEKKQVIIQRNYKLESELYYTVSTFFLPDVFIGA